VVDALRRYEAFPDGLAMAAGTNSVDRRNLIAKQRRFDDDWFFSNFNLDC
jgi:hypothetical protein